MAHTKLRDANSMRERYTYNMHKPWYYSEFGKVSLEPSSFRRHHFIAGYRSRMSTEWTPHMRATPIPPLSNQPPQIYFGSVGMLPHYTGHIPGAKYRFGRTYGNDTVDAKMWLRVVKPH